MRTKENILKTLKDSKNEKVENYQLLEVLIDIRDTLDRMYMNK